MVSAKVHTELFIRRDFQPGRIAADRTLDFGVL
nr:MAG TPA: hypothetical protein [Caudoviricetes sp.]